MGSCPSKNQPKKIRKITIRPIRTTRVDDENSPFLDNAAYEATGEATFKPSEPSASVKAALGADEGTSGTISRALEAVAIGKTTFKTSESSTPARDADEETSGSVSRVLAAFAMATEKQYERRLRLSNVDCVEGPSRPSGRRRSFLLSSDEADEVAMPDESVINQEREEEKSETPAKTLSKVSPKSESHDKTSSRSPDMYCLDIHVTSGSRRTQKRSSSSPAGLESSGEIEELAVFSDDFILSVARKAKQPTSPISDHLLPGRPKHERSLSLRSYSGDKHKYGDFY